jgi:hypothetical protein
MYTMLISPGACDWSFLTHRVVIDLTSNRNRIEIWKVKDERDVVVVVAPVARWSN